VRLDGYAYFHAARVDQLRRLGRHADAAASYRAALAITETALEQRFLERRLEEHADRGAAG